MRSRASPSSSATPPRLHEPIAPCALRPATLGDRTAQPRVRASRLTFTDDNREPAVKSTSRQGRQGVGACGVDVGWGLLGRTFTERRGVGRVGSKKSLDWANKVFWAGNPRGSDFEALKAVPAIGRIPRFWALSNRRRRNRAQVVGFVRQSHSDCALASGSAVGEGGQSPSGYYLKIVVRTDT